jgi:ribose transport system substrate-binding protein
MRRAVLICAVGATMALAACGGSSSGDKPSASGGGGGGGGDKAITLAVVPKLTGIDFYDQVRKGAQCAAKKAAGVTVQWDGTPTFDIEGEVNLLQNKLTAGVDGLVYAASDTKALYPVTKQALAQGIAVTNFDSGTEPQPEQAPLFATDNVANARKVADLMAKAIGPDGGDVALLRFNPGSQTDQQRKQGFVEGLKKYPKIKLVSEQDAAGDKTKALSLTQDMLTAHPGLKGIFASDEGSTVGSAQALQQTGKVGQVKIIGWDTSPDDLRALRQGAVQALIAQNPFKMGVDSVNAVVDVIRNDATPTSEDTGSVVVTKATLNDPEVEQVLSPTCS